MSAPLLVTVSAKVLRAQLDALATMLGPEAYGAVLARLSDDDRAVVEALERTDRAHAGLATRVLTEAAAQSGRELDELRDAVLHQWALHSFQTAWGSLLNPSNEETLAARAAAVVHRAYDRGEVVSATSDLGRCDVLVSAWAAMPEHAMHELRVVFRTTLELTGHRDVRVAVGRTPHGALFKLSWRT